MLCEELTKACHVISDNLQENCPTPNITTFFLGENKNHS